MVKDHKDDINEFEKEAKKGTDSLIVALANSSLDMLKRHLDSATSIDKLLNLNNLKSIPR